MFKLLKEIIDAQNLNDIMREEQELFLKETNPIVKNLHRTRIQHAREINKKYLTILN